jgi:hypothetical protein
MEEKIVVADVEEKVREAIDSVKGPMLYHLTSTPQIKIVMLV